MDAQLPPGPSGSQIGLLRRYVSRQGELLDECAERYGDPFTLALPRMPPMVIHSSPEAMKEIVTGTPTRCARASRTRSSARWSATSRCS